MTPPWTTRLAALESFAKSALTGGAATLVDLGVLGACVGILHLTPAAANAPALLAGATVQFFGNRGFAFRRPGGAAAGALGKQALFFAASEVITLILNFLLYRLVATHLSLGAGGAVVARAITTNTVFLLWSYPVWRRIFAPGPPVLGAAPARA